MVAFTGDIGGVRDISAEQTRTFGNTEVDRSTAQLLTGVADVASNVLSFFGEETVKSASTDAQQSIEDILQESITDPAFFDKTRKSFGVGARIPNATLRNLQLQKVKRELDDRYASTKARSVINSAFKEATGFTSPLAAISSREDSVEQQARATAERNKLSLYKEATKLFEPVLGDDGAPDIEATIAMANQYSGAGSALRSTNSSAGSIGGGAGGGRIRSGMLQQLQSSQLDADKVVGGTVFNAYKRLSQIDPTDAKQFAAVSSEINDTLWNLEGSIREKMPNLRPSEFSFVMSNASNSIKRWNEILGIEGGLSSSKAQKIVAENLKNANQLNEALIKNRVLNTDLGREITGLASVLGQSQALVFALEGITGVTEKLASLTKLAGQGSNVLFGSIAKSVQRINKPLDSFSLDGTGPVEDGVVGMEFLKASTGQVYTDKKSLGSWGTAVYMALNAGLEGGSRENQEVVLKQLQSASAAQNIIALSKENSKGAMELIAGFSRMSLLRRNQLMTELRQYEVDTPEVSVVVDNGSLKLNRPESNIVGAFFKYKHLDKLVEEINTVVEGLVPFKDFTVDKALAPVDIRAKYNFGAYHDVTKQVLPSPEKPFLEFGLTPEEFEKSNAWIRVGEPQWQNLFNTSPAPVKKTEEKEGVPPTPSVFNSDTGKFE